LFLTIKHHAVSPAEWSVPAPRKAVCGKSVTDGECCINDENVTCPTCLLLLAQRQSDTDMREIARG
jgi:hypothetical protein